MSQAVRRPVIAGIAQLTQKIDDPKLALSPLALMEQAIRDAAEDAGAPGLVKSLDAIYVPMGIWRQTNPGRLLAERLGCPAARTLLGALSGHIVQVLVDRACKEIAAGRADVIAIAGGESENSRRRLKRRGLAIHWDDESGGEPDERVGKFEHVRMTEEERAGLVNASTLFALCDTSLRHTRGESPAAHRDRLARLQADMSRIARTNAHAWIRDGVEASRIREPGPGNRMVNYPYTKLMTSNIAVDQGAALILCSEDAATHFGVPAAKRIHLRAATEMSHSTRLTEREHLHHHPGQALAARRALELARLGPEDLDHVDVYSCFPFAVQAGAAALGLPLDPPPTVTGGMTFFGGPLGSYVLHSKASLFERLRAEPGSIGAIGSLGGQYAHFGYGVYSTDPGTDPLPIVEDVSDAYAAMPRRTIRDGHAGPVRIESYTVDVGHEGPRQVTITTLTDDGVRVFGRSSDPDLMKSLLSDEDICGLPAHVRDGIVSLG